MKSLEAGLDRRAVIWIVNCTLGGTAGCTAAAMLITYCSTAGFGAEVMATTLRLAFYIPLLLAGPLFAFIGVKMQQLALANRLLVEASRYDGLTGCLNRGAFTADVIDFFAKQDLAPFPPTSALLILDADHFKKINDFHGHLAGDSALVAIAAVLRGAVGEEGVVGRLGGEEFGVFVRSTDAVAIGALAEHIRLGVAEDGTPEGHCRYAVTVSIGIALFTYPAVYEDIFKIADDQLYLAKGAGTELCLHDRALAHAGRHTRHGRAIAQPFCGIRRAAARGRHRSGRSGIAVGRALISEHTGGRRRNDKIMRP